MSQTLHVHSKPVIKDGKAVLEFYFGDAQGNYIREITEDEKRQIDEAFKQRILEFWRLPIGQLQEWGRVPKP